MLPECVSRLEAAVSKHLPEPKIQAGAVSGSDFGRVASKLTSQRMSGLDEQAVELGFTLVRTAASHMHELERIVHRPKGLSFSGFRIMYMIWLFEEIEARDLARLAGVSRQTTSTVLANLENSGLIRRERTSNTDKRLVAVQMTEAGHREIEHVFAEQNRLESEWFSALSLGERHQLKTLLDKVSISIADSAKKRN